MVSEWGLGDFDTDGVGEWLPKYQKLLGQFSSHPLNAGHCYVQLYDVENERNGLLTYDRKVKFTPKELEILKAANLQATKRDLSFDWDGFIKKR